MTEMRKKSASRAPINEAGPPHPPPKLLSPSRQHPNSTDFNLIQIGKTMAPPPITAPVRSDSRHGHTDFAPIRSHSQSFAVIRAYSRLIFSNV
jgi:hypothetical protein